MISANLNQEKIISDYSNDSLGVNIELLPTHTSDYHYAYALRRSSSTMAEVARKHLSEKVKQWSLDSIFNERPFRILSVGCGDGNLDLKLLQDLSGIVNVEYIGLEVNATSAQIFLDEIHKCKIFDGKGLSFEIKIQSAEILPSAGDGFDLVLMSHVLYYFKNKVEIVKDYLYNVCRIDGRLLIVHSGRDGIPSLMSDVPGLSPFLCAEEIRDALVKHGLRVDSEIFDSVLNATEILDQTRKGEEILGFCIEQQIDQISAITRKQLLKALWARCRVLEDGAWFSEPLAFLTLRNDLGMVQSHIFDSSIKHIDPVQDYHRLALSFNWLARLCFKTHETLRVLDIGCGTGRWLKVLNSHWPTLANYRDNLEYSAIDPSAVALSQAREQSQCLTQWGQGWANKIEDIQDMPLEHYDIAWSLHSLYCVLRPDLPTVLTRIVQSLKPEGLAVIALPDRSSFYITAAEELVGNERFTCSEDVCEVLYILGIAFEVRDVAYDEIISVEDDLALRTYVWQESIGNSFSSAPCEVVLPLLPKNTWFESHRREDVFAFPQNVRVITVRGGQVLKSARQRLVPDLDQMIEWASIASRVGIAEHLELKIAPVTESIVNSLGPRWVHDTHDCGENEQTAIELYTRLMRDPLPEWGDGDLSHLLQANLLPLLRQGTRDNAPGYMGYVPSGGLYLGAIAEWLAALFNRYSAMFMAAPGAASIEALCISWLADMTGLQDRARQDGLQAGGLLVSGASMATVNAVHAARYKAIAQGKEPGKLVAYYGRSAHGCVSQALTVCGIGHLRSIPIGNNQCVDMQALAEALASDLAKGLSPFFIGLSAGEVQTGAIDDLALGRVLADQYGVWLHVDGAYGGFFVIARSAPKRLKNIRLADSLVLDPHKGMGLPYGTGALLVRDVNDLRRAFTNHDGYLPPTPEFSRPPDVMDLGIEMTRPFRGLRLWLPIKLMGLAPFRDHLEQMLQLARWLSNELRSIPELEVIADPELSICCFRICAPASEVQNRHLLDEINVDGRFFITGCMIATGSSGFALRVALLSFRTDKTTLQALLQHVRFAVNKVLL